MILAIQKTKEHAGRAGVYTEGPEFTVYVHPFGCFEIARNSDGATVFFQGFDARELEKHLAEGELVADTLKLMGVNSVCDYICRNYFND